MVEMYEYLKEQKESVVIKGFEKAWIVEAVKSSQDIYRRCEKSFDDKRRKYEILLEKLLIVCIHCVREELLIKWS